MKTSLYYQYCCSTNLKQPLISYCKENELYPTQNQHNPQTDSSRHPQQKLLTCWRCLLQWGEMVLNDCCEPFLVSPRHRCLIYFSKHQNQISITGKSSSTQRECSLHSPCLCLVTAIKLGSVSCDISSRFQATPPETFLSSPVTFHWFTACYHRNRTNF